MSTEQTDYSWFKPIGHDEPLPTMATKSSYSYGQLTSRFRYAETEKKIEEFKKKKELEKKKLASKKQAKKPSSALRKKRKGGKGSVKFKNKQLNVQVNLL